MVHSNKNYVKYLCINYVDKMRKNVLLCEHSSKAFESHILKHNSWDSSSGGIHHSGFRKREFIREEDLQDDLTASYEWIVIGWTKNRKEKNI